MEMIRAAGAIEQELIDTLWNVNLSVHLTYLLSKSELIDTLWNVNLNAADVVQLKREN